MKVLHVITSLATGGAEKLMVDLLPELNKKGIECDLLIFDGTITPFRKKLEKRGIRIIDFGIGSKPYNPFNLFNLIPIISRYDIIHTHNTAPQLFVPIANIFYHKILVTTEHSTENRRRSIKWIKPIDKWMYARYHKIIAISDKTKIHLSKYLPSLQTPISTIPNGISLKEYKHVKGDQNIINSYPGIVKLFMVAGFRWQKDHKTVIDAMMHLPAHYHLFFVGNGETKVENERYVEYLGLKKRIHFLGVRTDVPKLLSTAEVCILSSHSEGFGLAAVEAMAAGKPVIASNVPGLAEVVRNAGILFEAGNSRQLAEKIVEITNNPELYLTIVHQEEIRANEFSISRMADDYTQVYNNLLEAPEK